MIMNGVHVAIDLFWELSLFLENFSFGRDHFKRDKQEVA